MESASRERPASSDEHSRGQPVPLSAKTLQKLIAGGESSTVEFKLQVPPDHVLAADLSAFANSQRGTLILGVNDKGEIIGLTEPQAQEALTRLRRVASSVLPMPAEISDARLGGKIIVYADVSPAPDYLRPIVTATGQVYLRRGSTSRLVGTTDALTLEGQQSLQVSSERQCSVFIAMSFRQEQEPALVDYYSAIRRAVAATNLPLELTRIDLVEGYYEISQRIMDEIDRCDIVVADFTLTPTNVYFEPGYARGCKNKQIVQTARKDTVLEFDVRNWRTEFYRNATELEEKLIPVLRSAYARATQQIS
jgi:hypothetical protein